jgi:hypothetical protein
MKIIRKIWIYLRNRITYQQILFVLLAIILILVYFTWPSLCEFFQKKPSYILDLPKDTIPFLIVEKNNQNLQYNTIYMAFWDLEQGMLYRDDTVPLAEVTGDIGQIFWTGNKQIYLCPANERGSLTIISQDSTYQIVTKSLINPNSSIIKPSADGKRVYEVMVEPQSGLLRLSYQSKNKIFTVESREIEGYPEYSIVKPIFFIPDNLNPTIYCFFQNKNTPKDGLGVIEGILIKDKITWSIWKELDENIKLSSISQCNFYNNEMVVSITDKLHIDQITDKKEIRDLNSANNYLSMFHNYLFGTSDSKGFIARQDISLTEQGFESPSLQVFDKYLLMNWTPNFISNKDFYIKQIIAINGTKSIGRIEIMDKKIRIFLGPLLISQETGDQRYLSTRWIFPNE